MSLIDEHSDECTTSPLEWFQVPPTQTSVEKSTHVEYQPITALSDTAPVEFYIPPSTEDYLDLYNTYHYIRFKIVKPDGSDIEATDKVAPINDIFNGLWSNVEVFLNDRLISHSNNTHGYMSMMKMLAFSTEEALSSQHSMRLVYKDTAGNMDEVDPTKINQDGLITAFHRNPEDVANAATALGNKGLHDRFLFTHSSQEVDLVAPLRIDVFEQEKYLPSGVGLKIRFHRQKPSYLLMTGADKAYKIKLLETSLLVRRVKPSPGVLLGHEEVLMNMNAKFPITRTQCKVLVVPKGVQNIQEDNVFLGQLPKRVVIGMVDNDAMAGSYEKNPYNFKAFNLNRLALFTDGEPVMAKPLTPRGNNYIRCYQSLFQGLNKLGESGSIIKREDWNRGYALYAFDLTPDLDHDDHYPLVKHGNLRIEAEFSAALPNTINVLVYAEFDNVIEITHSRNIIYDYS